MLPRRPERHVPDRALITVVIVCTLFVAQACAQKQVEPIAPFLPSDLSSLEWEAVVERARGTTVTFAMWSGDEARNRFFQGPVADALMRDFGITLRFVPLGDTVELVNKLVNEKGAGVTSGGSTDLVWINGENFRTAKQAGVLWGPFAEQLPNIAYYEETARTRDFGTPIDGFEAPWQRAQFVMAYDRSRVPQPPTSIAALRAWIEAHPGRFTHPAPPDFTGSVFLRHLLFSHGGGAEAFVGPFNESLYIRASAAAIDDLNRMKPYFWRSGETFPATPKELDRLFANGEIDFSMNYGPAFASERIRRGEFPETVRTFVFDEGTISSYSFLAIPFNTSNPVGALVVANYLMSPAHAIEKSRELGSVFPIPLDRLTPGQRNAVAGILRGPATLSAAELADHAVPEADAEYVARFERDWRERVLRQ